MKFVGDYVCAAAVALLCASPISMAVGHDIPEHGLRVELPTGWQRIEALSGNTILKLARTDASGNQARIVLVAFLVEQMATRVSNECLCVRAIHSINPV
ncbi:MAG: hypothetical protein ACOX1P_10175 [Thermoguttaceae bacterium]|jgi:hypothetical protein